jgi:hypothetical protein
MRFTYLKAFNIRFFRVNLSKSGFGYSVGALEHFLPDVDLDHGNLNYTVVLGEVLGNYETEQRP